MLKWVNFRKYTTELYIIKLSDVLSRTNITLIPQLEQQKIKQFTVFLHNVEKVSQ